MPDAIRRGTRLGVGEVVVAPTTHGDRVVMTVPDIP